MLVTIFHIKTTQNVYGNSRDDLVSTKVRNQDCRQ